MNNQWWGKKIHLLTSLVITMFKESFNPCLLFCCALILVFSEIRGIDQEGDEWCLLTSSSDKIVNEIHTCVNFVHCSRSMWQLLILQSLDAHRINMTSLDEVLDPRCLSKNPLYYSLSYVFQQEINTIGRVTHNKHIFSKCWGNFPGNMSGRITNRNTCKVTIESLLYSCTNLQCICNFRVCGMLISTKVRSIYK